MLCKLPLLISVATLTMPVSAQQSTEQTPTVIKIPAKVFEDKEIYRYFSDVLKLALDKTASNETPTIIKTDPANASQDRLLRRVKEGATDVTWAVSSAEREQENLAVYVPLARGLLGYRVFIVHPDLAKQFADIEIDALKQLIAVQGAGWPDTETLRYNNLEIEEVPYRMTFKLIDTRMADYFPRSVIEVQAEINNRPQLSLALEESVALYYPSPVYFFVNKANTQLANRIHRGLDIALQDGSFTALFDSQTFATVAKKQFKNRRVISLENPTLTEKSKLALKTYQSYLVDINNQ